MVEISELRERARVAKSQWRTLSSRYPYENSWMRIREDQVVRPDGAPGIYGVVETMRAAGVVALTRNQEVVLVGQYRYPTQVYSWEIVEGGTRPEEHPLDAVRRELREEAGLSASQFMLLGPEIHLSNSLTDERAFLYLAWELSEIAADPEGTEVLDLQRVPLAEALGMVRRGEIVDAMSIVAIERASRLLEGGRLYRMGRGEI
jgi:8-oxo-dGTP pyrophosphatase MutT (NUDIX family)